MAMLNKQMVTGKVELISDHILRMTVEPIIQKRKSKRGMEAPKTDLHHPCTLPFFGIFVWLIDWFILSLSPPSLPPGHLFQHVLIAS